MRPVLTALAIAALITQPASATFEPAEHLWRPPPPPDYGLWPADSAAVRARNLRDKRDDRRASDTTAAEAWADLHAGGVLPAVPSSALGMVATGATGSAYKGDENDREMDGEMDGDPLGEAAVRALETHPELFPQGRSLRGQGSLTSVVQSIQDVEHLERRAVSVGKHMSDMIFPSVLAGDEVGGNSNSGMERAAETRLFSGAVAERQRLERAHSTGIPMSLQRMLRPDATGGPESRDRRLKREFDSVVWRLRGPQPDT